jgi:hypothetical protein
MPTEINVLFLQTEIGTNQNEVACTTRKPQSVALLITRICTLFLTSIAQYASYRLVYRKDGLLFAVSQTWTFFLTARRS